MSQTTSINIKIVPGNMKTGPGLMILAFLLCTAMISFSSAAAAEESDVKSLPKESLKPLYMAQQALQEENFDEAIKAITEYMARAKQPIPAPAYLMLGHSYYQKEDIENALKTFKTAYQVFPESPEIIKNYAILNYEGEHFLEAAQLFEKLYAITGKKDKKILYQAAGIYFYAEKLGEAKRVLTQLLTEEGEKDPKWYEDIIAISIELAEWKEAENWAKVLLELQPARSEYWRLLAQVRLDREEYKLAASDLEIAYRLENAGKNEWLELSDLYLYLNAPLMAIRCIEAAHESKPPSDARLRLARIYGRTMRYDEAIAEVNEAYRKDPSAAVLLEKGRLLYEAKRYPGSIEALDACVKMNPKQGDAWMLMGFAAWNMKKWDKARTAFASASTLSKYRIQANEAVAVLDDLIEAFKRSTQPEALK